MLIDEAIHGKALLEKGKQVQSRRMRARRKNDGVQRKTNTCPFGCKVRDLDDQSYCRHVVGCCTAQYEGADKTAIDITESVKLTGNLKMEPMVKVKGRRKITVERERINTGEVNEDGKPDFEWGDPILPFVRVDDVLERVTCSYLVYRDIDKAAREQAQADQLAARERDIAAKEAELAAREAKVDGRKNPDRKARRPMSEETKAKMREIAKRNFAARQAKKAEGTTPEA